MKVEIALRYLTGAPFSFTRMVKVKMDFKAGKPLVKHFRTLTKLELAKAHGVSGPTPCSHLRVPERMVMAATTGQMYSLRCRQSFLPDLLCSPATQPSASIGLLAIPWCTWQLLEHLVCNAEWCPLQLLLRWTSRIRVSACGPAQVRPPHSHYGTGVWHQTNLPLSQSPGQSYSQPEALVWLPHGQMNWCLVAPLQFICSSSTGKF